MRLNRLLGRLRRTHEGAPARALTPEQALRRSVMACLLWEDQFYEDGVSIAERIAALVPKVAPAAVAALAVAARRQMHLRHCPLLLVREMARHASHRPRVADTLDAVVRRADELTEFLALYWAEGKRPLAGQVKRGLARAFTRFDAYQLAKYDRPAPIRLRDVMFLVHPKPRDDAQAAVWRRLADRTLPSPDTWEVALSRGAEDKAAAWTRLLAGKRLGALALLRNLRNMVQAGVDEGLIRAALGEMRADRVLPFRFLAAADHAPRFEPELQRAMFASLAARPTLPGKTVLLVDVSGSMVGTRISRRSELDRLDAAAGVALLVRELCDTARLYAFSSSGWSHVEGAWCAELPPRRGFALRDALRGVDHGGTPLGWAVERCTQAEQPYDRLIVLTDEQSADKVPAPGGRGYMVNVASYENGVGYGAWTHVDGWSEAVLDYIREIETAQGD